MTSNRSSENGLYEQDYYLWLEKTAQTLRDRNCDLDWDNLLEEIKTLGRSEKKSVKSNLRVVLLHLLKWKYQHQKRSRSWFLSLAEHRQRLYDDFEDSPSLKSYCHDAFAKVYGEARKQAARETDLSLSHFPEVCPFNREQALAEDWLPE